MTEAKAYADSWYAKNRFRVLEKRCQKHAAAILHLTTQELAVCQRDPRKVWTIRGPKWIACLECGELHEQLGHHLRVRHGLSAAAYKALPGLDSTPRRFSKNASLLSLELRERLSKKRTKLRLGRLLHKSGKVPPVRKLIASRGKRVLSQQYRLEQGERAKRGSPKLWGKHRGRALGYRVEDWQIARPAADGVSDDAIARSLGMPYGESIGTRRRRIGFSAGRKKARVYYHGRPLVGRDIRNACEDLEITRESMAGHLGLKYKTVKAMASRQRAERPLSTLVGRRFREAYEKLRDKYRRRPQDANTGGRPSLLLPHERAAIRLEYERLHRPVKVLLKWIEDQRANDSVATFEQTRQYVYLEARKGRLRELALWPEFLEWCGEGANLLSFKPFNLVYEFLAHVYKVKVGSIRKALESPKGGF